MKRQKTAAAVHDISGFGKCSLTVALPILSAAGIAASIMPTAVLSTCTGEFEGFTFRDLTGDLRQFMHHWKSLGLSFDALYSGFLGSFEQLEIIGEFIDMFGTDENLVVVDPAMADNGKLYSIFTPDFAAGMTKLCAKADLIVPNMTEAAVMLGESYREGPYEKAYIENTLTALSKLGPQKTVLTGVYFDEKKLGAACFDKTTGEISYAMSGRIDGFFHGTGDIFASALLAGLLNGKNLSESAQIAADFTSASILRTKAAGTDARFGVNFEAGLPEFSKRLGLL